MSSNIQIEKVCQWCGKNFIARTTQTAYCSKRCAEHAYKDRKRKEKMGRCKEEVRRVQTGMKEIDEKEFLTPPVRQLSILVFAIRPFTSISIKV